MNPVELMRAVTQDLGLSQNTLATRLGVTKRRVRHWATGKPRPRPRLTGLELAAARKTLDLTQQELADDLGIVLRTLQRWEAEDCKTPEMVSRIVRAALADRTLLEKIAAA